ncbi:hypothetical protein [Metaclostridioides mangenotii]|uniref:hypothetical protein n=1 Tax=Metaclostridioides mangenotii TaxID=1540 RepID=UPI0004B74BAA|nr:hypothetical protein [Clostridioides mangenotii]
MRLHGSMQIIENELSIGGVPCTELAKKYSTPLYVIDEKLIRENCREYIDNFNVKEGKNKIAYAGKAFLPINMCEIIDEEGMSLMLYQEESFILLIRQVFQWTRCSFTETTRQKKK